MEFFHYAYLTIAVLLFFSSCIFVHELGHFWTAYKFGLKIEAFAIGFGPKLWSKVHNGTEYSIRIIPLGGFVRVPQLVDQEILEGKSTKDPLPPVALLPRIIVLAAGAFMNIAFAVLITCILFITGYPVPVDPPIIGNLDATSVEYKLGLRDNDLITRVDGRDVENWDGVFASAALACSNVVAISVNREGKSLAFNVATVDNEQLSCKMLMLPPKEEPSFGTVLTNSPAAAAGLQSRDTIKTINKLPVTTCKQAQKILNANGTNLLEIAVNRSNQVFVASVTPDNNGKIGVLLQDGASHLEVRHIAPWTQIWETLDLTFSSFNALAHSKTSHVGVSDLSGPPGIITIIAANLSADIRLALKFLVFFNINLAVLNLLPLPILDGGHIALALLAAITGRKIPAKLLHYVFNAFAICLLGFMAYASWNDVKRFDLLRWFHASPAPAVVAVHPPDPATLAAASASINNTAIAMVVIFVLTIIIGVFVHLRRHKLEE